jgi:hypothetical protein
MAATLSATRERSASEPEEASPRRWRLGRVFLAAAALVLVHGCLTGWQACHDSAGWDEVGHFAAGIDHLRTGSFHVYNVNPPLVSMVALLPVALFDPVETPSAIPTRRGPGRRPEFALGEALAAGTGPHYFRLLAAARLMALPFSLATGIVCFRWASQLWGTASGLLALLIWVLSPSAIAYGHLITSDAGATAMGLLAAYSFRHWLRQPTVGRALIAGLLLGLAQLTKTTWVILFCLWPLLWGLWRLLGRSDARVHTQRPAIQVVHLVFIGIVALWVLNLGYGFEGSFTRLGNYSFLSRAFRGGIGTVDGFATGNRFASGPLAAMPVPLPENYLLGVDYIKMEYERKYWSYLNGEWRFGGWWYYYLYAMSIKEPLGTWGLGLLAVGAAAAFRGSYAAPLREELLLLVPMLAVLTLVSSQTGFSHHLRYVLPAFPFLFILIGRLGRSFERGDWKLAAAVCLLLGWSVVSSLSVVPHSMSYFNELAGGPKNGWRHLDNSNTDWGQDLLYLSTWYDRHPEARPLHVGYDLRLIDPKMLGIDWQPIPVAPPSDAAKRLPPEELAPLPGWYAVSVNWRHDGRYRFTYFNSFEPVDWVGYTMPIYHITTEQANLVRRRLGLPALAEGAGVLPASGRPTPAALPSPPASTP